MNQKLLDLIKKYAPDIKSGPGVNNEALLYAIAMNESSGGINKKSRYEKSYGPGGFYYEKSEAVRNLWKQYGCIASSSLGTWQLMYPTACELGFLGKPDDLNDDEVEIKVVIKFLNKRVFDKKKNATVRDCLDAYNSGSFNDSIIPEKYIASGLQYYSNFVAGRI